LVPPTAKCCKTHKHHCYAMTHSQSFCPYQYRNVHMLFVLFRAAAVTAVVYSCYFSVAAAPTISFGDRLPTNSWPRIQSDWQVAP
jgi:hypothetical protein